jgi:hypothetical protein
MAKDSTSGTGRLVIRYSTAKRRRGKPPLAARIERDRMVAYVLRLQKRGQSRSRAVEATAEFFRCDERTVWTALREYYPPKVKFPVVEWGEPALYTTVCIGPVVIIPTHAIRIVSQVDHEPQSTAD